MTVFLSTLPHLTTVCDLIYTFSITVKPQLYHVQANSLLIYISFYSFNNYLNSQHCKLVIIVIEV